jgi:GMP synthase (glutamine-hydrolysing)
MILVLDCTRQDRPLLRDEFVSPVTGIVSGAGYETRVAPLDTLLMPAGVRAVILTGTALMDCEYLRIGLPGWLFSWGGPVLGICAGMQLLVISADGELVPEERIGMAEISSNTDDPLFSGKERFNAWEMHRSGVIVSGGMRILATSASGVQAIRYLDRPWYGVMFHPEVRNEWVILNFLRQYA